MMTVGAAVGQVAGQESFLLSTRSVELAVTVVGGHLAPVTFFPGSARPVLPYAIAPWAEEPIPTGTPPVLATLRGDFFCSAFGANEEPVRDQRLPLHGETANDRWEWLEGGECGAGAWMRLGMDLPLQGGRCEATTALLVEHSVIYQRHDFSGLTGRINPGHHATLSLPDTFWAGRLSFSRIRFAHTSPEPLESVSTRGASALAPNVEIKDVTSVRCADGSVADLTRYPDRRGFEDIAIVCADPKVPLAWSAVTVPQKGYLWFAMRNPTQLASTLLWFSNGGRRYPPWNGRHLNVLGIEDMTGFFHIGLATSCRPNLLNEHGVPTALEPGPEGRLSVPYIQGVARIPPDFDCLVHIEPGPGTHEIVLHAESGRVVVMKCCLDFLRMGRLEGLGFE
jgi:hypothetical protein